MRQPPGEALHDDDHWHAINLIIGNNATAVEAAGNEARRLGYTPATESAAQSEGAAEEVGRQLAERAEMRRR